jgi:hypothetical protein
MYTQNDKHLVYLAHPKTASHSTVAALEPLGFSECFPIEGHHAPLHEKRLLNRYKWPARSKWTVFTTIRNPWDWAVSLAFARRKFQQREIPAVEWTVEMFKDVLKPCFYIQENRMFALHADVADVILKFENLDEELNELLRQCDLGPVSLQTLRPTPWRENKHYREFHTDETRDYIAERFKDEIAQYGYEF